MLCSALRMGGAHSLFSRGADFIVFSYSATCK